MVRRRPDDRSLDALVSIIDAYIHESLPGPMDGWPIPLLDATDDGLVRAGRLSARDATLWHLVRTRHYLASRERSD